MTKKCIDEIEQVLKLHEVDEAIIIMRKDQRYSANSFCITQPTSNLFGVLSDLLTKSFEILKPHFNK